MKHIQTTFEDSELIELLQGIDTVICLFTGSDIHLSSPLISAASAAGVELFIPSEYGLDTSNPKIRELLPPYRIRFEIQDLLVKSNLRWTSLYNGLVLEEALSVDGVFGIDVLWASVSVFPHKKSSEVPISSYEIICNKILDVISRDIAKEEIQNEIWACGFRVTLEEIIEVVEEQLEKPLDRYMGDFEGARKEAGERMKMGYFDGGVALMGKVAVWEEGISEWGDWEGNIIMQGWKEDVRRVVRLVRGGVNATGGCGC